MPLPLIQRSGGAWRSGAAVVDHPESHTTEMIRIGNICLPPGFVRTSLPGIMSTKSSVWIAGRAGELTAVLAFICLWFGASNFAHGAAAWPMFRGGPQLLGVANGSIEKELALLWTYKTGGPVKSSAAVVGGKVFIGSGDQHVHAIDFATGKTNWTFKTEGEIEASPLVLDGKVFVGGADAWFYALDAESGKLAWKYQTGDKILSSANYLKSPKGDATWIVFGSYDNRLYCLDAATGKSNWVYETGNYINGSPAVANGQTVFGGCDAILHVLNLADGTKVKEIEAGAYIAASVALEGGKAYFVHYENEFLCIDLAKGTNQWNYKDRGFPYFSSPAVTSDRVVFGGRDKRLHCVEKATGKSVWVFGTRGKVDSSPVVVGDKVVVGSDDGRLYIVSLKDGSELWSYEIGQSVGSSPAVVDGKVIVGSEDGSVYCFGGKPAK